MQGFSQLAELWNRLDQKAKTVVLVTAVLCIAGLIAITRFQSNVAYGPLYSNLAPEDAGQITEKLKAQKTPYRLSNGGTCIEVPEEKVYEQRIALAKEGLPSSGQVGFELFDKSGLPGTEFSNRINYQRALQGELARTISAMAEIRSARVHLVLPEESLFSERSKPSASVVLQTKAGAAVTPELTAAVAHIVASAVQDVKAEEVTVVDSSGRVLRGPESGGKFGGLTATQFEIQSKYQDQLCVSLQSMLDTVLGPNQSVVRVQAQLDFDAEESKNESIVPVVSGKGLVSSEKMREEQYRGTGSSSSTGGSGLQANLGMGGGIAGGSSGNSGSYVNRDETRQYEYSRNTTSMVKTPGKLKSLTVAAIIDETLSPSAEEQVKQVITTAAGLNTQRGDVVTVERMKIQAAETAKTEEKASVAAEKSQRSQGLLKSLLRGALSLAAAALIFMSVMTAMRQFRQATVPYGTPEQSEVTAFSPQGVAPATRGGQSQYAESDTYDVDAVTELNPTIREQLRQIASADTEAVADRIQALLQKEGSA